MKKRKFNQKLIQDLRDRKICVIYANENDLDLLREIMSEAGFNGIVYGVDYISGFSYYYGSMSGLLGDSWSATNYKPNGLGALMPSDFLEKEKKQEFPREIMVDIGNKIWRKRTAIGEIYDEGESYFISRRDDVALIPHLRSKRFCKEIEEECKEVTLEEVAKKFGVSVDRIKIKK